MALMQDSLTNHRETVNMKRKVTNINVSAAISGLFMLAAVGTAFADADLDKRVQDPNQWATQTGGYNSQHNRDVYKRQDRNRTVHFF